VGQGEERLSVQELDRPESNPSDSPPQELRRARKMPKWLTGNLLLLPTTAWLVIFLVIPTLIIIWYSLGARGVIVPVRVHWNDLRWSNYHDAVDPDVLPIFIRTLVYASVTTVVCIALGFPLAYWIARFGGRFRNVLLVLVVIPFLTSYLIRMYAWSFIFQRNNGLLNARLADIGHFLGWSLGWLGVSDHFWIFHGGHQFLGTHFAVLVGLTYGFLPFMTLPLYASIERMDPALVEASYDLGQGKASTFFRVIVPSVSPGLVAGILLVFIPALGDFVTPQVLGGRKTAMFGNTVADKFGSSNNWPLGSAMSVLLMVFILIGVFVYLSRVGEDVL
jgi:spermidine/putrescine transport system permease protein